MKTEIEPNAIMEEIKYWNELDEAYGFLCLSISKDLLFHITKFKTLKDIWDQITSFFDKQDDIWIYQQKNELISLNPSSFETMMIFSKIQGLGAPVKAVQG